VLIKAVLLPNRYVEIFTDQMPREGREKSDTDDQTVYRDDPLAPNSLLARLTGR
jgi:hypothetical protein